MDSQTSDKQSIQKIVKQLAEGSASAESAEQLQELLDTLAQEGDLESLTAISGAIREQFESARSKEDKHTGAPFNEVSQTLAKAWTGFSMVHKAAVIAGSLVIVLVIALVAANLLKPSEKSMAASRSPREGTSAVSSNADVTQEAEVPAQSDQTGASATVVTSPEVAKAESAAATPTRSPSPTPSRKEYTILACVRWQDDQEVGLPGSQIAWWASQDEASREEIIIPHDDGCVKLPIFVIPDTEITLMAQPPQDSANLQILGHTEEDSAQAVAWKEAEDEGAWTLTTTLGEETSTELTAQFVVAAERTLSGAVLNEDESGIAGAEVQLWGRTDSKGDWQSIDQTTTTGPDGTFVLTHTTGSPQMFYRIGLDNKVANRYVYTTTSVSGPSRNWIGPADSQTPATSFIETRTALGPDQLGVEDVVFNQALEYVLLRVDEATLEPRGLEWETDSVSSGPDEIMSKSITIDPINVNTLKAGWQNVELPPGTYALEIWTPENSSARVIYSLLASDRVLDNRVSYQSTRQERGQVNDWIDFSITTNPSLIIELPAAAPVTVLAEPSPRPDNVEYNLSGDVVFGVGPVRFVKQQ